MGGKTKQSQRTKNNARPSSSGRSAELLQNAVNLDHSMLAGGPKMVTSLFPTLATPNFELGLPSEFLLCIKKLNKKDPITKVKALQELTELVNNSKVDDVVLILQSWTHFYKILTVDTDCKVREATQVCHGAVSRSCGRRLAPALRGVMPAWLQAQYDDHAPAMAQANSSLKATFPENKLPEVISFCKAEVMAHFMDNLLGNAEKTLTKRIEEPEERAVQLQCVVTSSLRGLQYLAVHLPAAHDDWLYDELKPLFEANAFWKYASHSNHHLKAAWFVAMTSLLERFSSRFADKLGARLAKSLLGAVVNPPPLVAPNVWGCLLQLMYRVPDWNKWLDKKDLLTKRILDMLEKGGWGDAKRLTDLLLPLLAHLPQDILSREFYEAFFIAFFNGLRTKSISNSKSERQYWITSLAECLRYLSIQNNDFVIEVTTSVHRMWLRTVLFTEYNQVRTNLIKHSATNMASLVKFWLKQSKEINGEKYDQLVRNFWQNVCTSLLLQIDKPPAEDIEHIIEGHILLLQTLKTGFLSEAKKIQSIKFDDDVPNEQEQKTVTTQVVDADAVERYKHNLNEVVEKICCAYLEYADKNDISESILTPLITIFNDFDGKNLYIALSKHFGANGVYDFYEKVLLKWLMTDTMRCKSVVDIVFTMLQHLTEEEQEAVMASFDKVGAGALEWVVQQAASHRQWRRPAARRWLRGPAAARALRALARRPPAHTLLACLCADHRAENLISESTVTEIASIVSQSLQEALAGSGGGLALEPAAALAAQLGTALAARPGVVVADYHHLMLALFQLLLLVPQGDPRLPGALWGEVRGALHDALAATPAAARPARRAHLMAQAPAPRTDSINIPEIEHLTSLCPYLLVECNDPEPPADVTEIAEFTQQAFDLRGETNSIPIEMLALRYDCITNKLNCPFDDDNDVIKAVVEDASNDDPVELTIENLVPYINKFLFRVLFLHKCFLHKVNSDDDEEEPQSKTWCRALLSNEYLRMEFCKVLREYMVLKTLEEAYSFWLHHDLIKDTNTKVNTIIDEVISETPDDLRMAILSMLSERAAKEGYYWAYARKFFQTKVSSGQEEDLTPAMDVDKLEKIATGNGFFHCLQANAQQCGDVEASLRCQFGVMSRSLLGAFPAAAEPMCSASLLAACAAADLDPVVHLYHKHDPIMLYERDILSMPWSEVVAEAAVLQAVAGALRLTGWSAPQHHWDFATVTLCAVISNIHNASNHCGTTKVSVLSHAAARLYGCVQELVAGVPRECERRLPAAHVAALPGEWAHVFGPALSRDLYATALRLLECGSRSLSSNLSVTISAVWACIRAADWALIDRAHRARSLALEALVTEAAGALARPLHAAYHCLAYHVLLALDKPLADYDAEQLSLWSSAGNSDGDDGEEPRRPQLSPRWTLPALAAALTRADAALTHLTAGVETCEVAAASTEHGVMLGALLLADAVHLLRASAAGDLAHHHMLHYREGGYTAQLLPVSLRLVPAWLLAPAAAAAPAAPHKPARVLDLFLAAPTYGPADGSWRGAVGALACRALYVCVSAGGADVRAWWAAAGRRGAALERILRDHCGPALAARELARVRAAPAPPHAQVRVHPTLPEVTLEAADGAALTVRYQPAHPLAPPAVTARGPRAAATAAWLRVYLGHQNGSLVGAARLWAAADAAGDGAACYVCYCRLQPSTGQPPDRSCGQCHNRYHRHCLRKWFVTSQRTSCPLCRTPF